VSEEKLTWMDRMDRMKGEEEVEISILRFQI
jgi:hypothetical protein